jgi:Dockerin type I domain
VRGLLLVVVVFSIACVALGDEPAFLKIAVPPEGTQVVPGQSLFISVETDPNSTFEALMIIGESSLFTHPVLQTSSPSISTANAAVRSDAALGLHIVAAGGLRKAGEKYVQVASSPIHLDVECDFSLSAMQTDPVQIAFAYSGDQTSLSVSAKTPEGRTLDVSRSTRVIYSSQNPNVATINTETGEVTATGPGNTNLHISYVNPDGTRLLVDVPIVVPKLVQGDLNGDGRVTASDLAILQTWLGRPVAGPNDARDLNHDGKIDEEDVEIMKHLIEEQNEKDGNKDRDTDKDRDRDQDQKRSPRQR